MGNYVCPTCGATAGGPGRCRQHPAGKRPRLRFVDAGVYQPPEMPYPFAEAAAAHDQRVAADMMREWDRRLRGSGA